MKMRFVMGALAVAALSSGQGFAQAPANNVPSAVRALTIADAMPDARGVLFGLTRDTTAAELARAALEGVARRRILIHINNTNPILIEDSPERRAVEKAGFEVAEDGMRIAL